VNFLQRFPWKYLVRRLAKRGGFIDPFSLLERLERFAQRSEVSVPAELLRAGVAFHARGLLNTKAIQTNRDWVWPYWVEEQFDPASDAFLPRAFSITHVNLTHRNWTGLGLPGCAHYPVVDPRGLLTPYLDGWSIDAWVVDAEGQWLFPSRQSSATQTESVEDDHLTVTTAVEDGPRRLRLQAWCAAGESDPVCRLAVEATAGGGGRLVVALRPTNPEGVSLIDRIDLADDRCGWTVDGVPAVRFDEAVDRHVVATHREGDVQIGCLDREEASGVECEAGLAMAAAIFALPPTGARTVDLTVDLGGEREAAPLATGAPRTGWTEALAPACRLTHPAPRFEELFDASLRTLVLLTPGEVAPGPYTYKRFWFRDAALMLHAMLLAGLEDRALAALETFADRQTIGGYFRSQDGEWDSNGQVLWILRRAVELTGRPLGEAWRKRIRAAAEWIHAKRCPVGAGELHDGLLPAGFSAEHLGNNDYYLWDDYWAVAGLQAAGWFFRRWDDAERADAFEREADHLSRCIAASLERSAAHRRHPGLPASPYRRMDAGAIGSLAASYPLGLVGDTDPAVAATVGFLTANCFVEGAFFQDMIHAGLNAYLTLHVAQCLLRSGEGARALAMTRRVADLASPTGHWPEAIHPRTGGGCMGDGHHGWAAAEWVVMLRNLFVREEADGLVLAGGLAPEALGDGTPVRLGPTATPWGPLHVEAETDATSLRVRWRCALRGDAPPALTVAPPGLAAERIKTPPAEGEVRLPLGTGAAGSATEGAP